MSARLAAAADAIPGYPDIGTARKVLAAADAVMFSDENEAWLAQIVASYGVDAPFTCAAEIIAALTGDGA